MTVSPATTAATTAASASAASTSTKSLSSLAGNFQDFLKLLMTQLQNQDPTSPMDTNQFTSQLVQFASVEQQIDTNSSLTKLIEATQGSAVLQSSALIGKQVQVASDHVPLQNGKGVLNFDTGTSQTVQIGIYADSGAKLREATLTSTPGSNAWTWDGLDSNGKSLPDGSYRAVLVDGSGSALPFTVTGTASAMHRDSDGVQVSLGALNTSLSKVQAVGETK